MLLKFLYNNAIVFNNWKWLTVLNASNRLNYSNNAFRIFNPLVAHLAVGKNAFFFALLTIRFAIINSITFKINNNKIINFHSPLVAIIALASFAITVAPGNLTALNNPFGKWF
ncbi:hypothetical protein GGTG_08652 [Gaeumannomyces tritici R3-111a-1]|uniref:Uncharacterized protein n=1 Tax=Gaeumannomyces tritici (strain R3-111a-1) TaxID=644352 RepID=J3P563_GAET3|nr:hypothetical protein GGTG_08652 [Gaeumannomyces tritici R3-111a-1]EJT74814.1 hypothetical protein GGTG_08652 [Gaeumannomyces tritici R3-111a-1]